LSNLKLIENRLAVKKKVASKKTTTLKTAPKKTAAKTTSKSSKKNNLEQVIVNSIKDKKGEDIVSLDLSHINDAIANCFIICQADSTVQVKAIAEHIMEETGKQLDELPWHKEGLQRLEWVLLDYVDCVVHIFQPQAREFYQLEDLWHDAKRKEHR
jgi:ribosome-associated protein